jgi:ankyrin repeat protein
MINQLNPIHACASEEELAATTELTGADTKDKDFIEYPALHIAARDGSLETVQNFINAGEDVNAKTSNGYTPLHIASESGHLDVAKS